MALEHFKEWNDNTSWQEIVELAKRLPSRSRIAIVARERRVLDAIVCHHMQQQDVGFTYHRWTHLCFANGITVKLATVAEVWSCGLRGIPLAAAYLVDSFTWPLIEQDTVRCELAPLLGRHRAL